MTTSARTRAALRCLPLARLHELRDGIQARQGTAPRSTARTPRRDASRSTSRVTPAVAARARARDIDTSTITGTGIGGRVTTADVDTAAQDALYARLFPGAATP